MKLFAILWICAGVVIIAGIFAGAYWYINLLNSTAQDALH